MFPISNAFDSVFHFMRLSSHTPQLQIANEELCLCFAASFPSPTPHQFHSSPSFSVHTEWTGALQDTLKLCSIICTELFVSACASSPAETVINLHWLSHQAHSTCAPAHLSPTDESTWSAEHAAVSLMMAGCLLLFYQVLLSLWQLWLHIDTDVNPAEGERYKYCIED